MDFENIYSLFFKKKFQRLKKTPQTMSFSLIFTQHLLNRWHLPITSNSVYVLIQIINNYLHAVLVLSTLVTPTQVRIKLQQMKQILRIDFMHTPILKVKMIQNSYWVCPIYCIPRCHFVLSEYYTYHLVIEQHWQIALTAQP